MLKEKCEKCLCNGCLQMEFCHEYFEGKEKRNYCNDCCSIGVKSCNYRVDWASTLTGRKRMMCKIYRK